MEGSIEGPPRRRMLAGWWSVFHQSTENLMMGTLTKPASARMAAARAPRVGSSKARRQRHVAEIEEEQDQHRGEAGIPHPPGAPHRLAPQRPASQRQEGEAGPDRRGRARRHVGQRMTPDQRGGAGGGDEAVDEQRHPGGRHVDVHDAHGLALLVVGRRVEEREVEAEREQDRCRRGEPGQHGIGDPLKARRVGEAMHGA